MRTASVICAVCDTRFRVPKDSKGPYLCETHRCTCLVTENDKLFIPISIQRAMIAASRQSCGAHG